MPKIITANGPTELEPVYCEVTGDHIAWKTHIPEDKLKIGYTPAYVSFRVVNSNGHQLILTNDMTTF